MRTFAERFVAEHMRQGAGSTSSVTARGWAAS
jgi:hypothetical protein